MLLAEQRVGEARERRARRMSRRELHVTSASAVAYGAAAIALLVALPSHRPFDPLLAVILLVGYAVASRVHFEFGGWYVSCEQLLFVPALFLLPLPAVPAFVAVAGALSTVPDFRSPMWRDRLMGCFAEPWGAFAPVLVLAVLAPGPVDLSHTGVYVLALVAQIGLDCSWGLLRNALLDRVPVRETLESFYGIARVDVVMSPVALMFAVGGQAAPLAVLTLLPLIWLFTEFSRDRAARYENALELQRAYRGTVTLLSDVVEFDDPYTAAHSRSIVELVDATAEKLGVPQEDRQRLEFTALLHDVGKIAIPKEILNKPAKLNDEEFALMKTHTIEGQFMLDRVGGFLAQIGEVVRSCHERWDGNGYPDGLKGEEIPFAARLVFCCDAYNAMTTDRVYRPAMSPDAAIEELEGNAGTQFDPLVVRALVEVVKEGEPPVAGDHEIRMLLAQQSAAAAVPAQTTR
jgi:HD domain